MPAVKRSSKKHSRRTSKGKTAGKKMSKKTGSKMSKLSGGAKRRVSKKTKRSSKRSSKRISKTMKSRSRKMRGGNPPPTPPPQTDKPTKVESRDRSGAMYEDPELKQKAIKAMQTATPPIKTSTLAGETPHGYAINETITQKKVSSPPTVTTTQKITPY
jgi:hypothetical protein